MSDGSNFLIFRRLGINTQHEHTAYMRADCHVCISEGFEALTRILVSAGDKSVVASLNVVHSDILKPGEIGLSEGAEHALEIRDGSMLNVSHLHPINSLSYVRSKVYGNALSSEQMHAIISDIVHGFYSNVHLAAFVASCTGNRLSIDEIVYLTQAMIDTGEQMSWNENIVVDKHCVGGLPGNRTTPIVVSIVAAAGLIMPKTSSRAITSPAGTADTMEVITNVNLTLDDIRTVVEQEGGCFVWGGTAGLSPADDTLIKVERALEVDSEGQLIASVLSKKVAAGSNHVVIDIPVGETAKIRSLKSANKLRREMEQVAEAIGLKLNVLITDGAQPVGRGIGPALEAKDILAVLRNEDDAPVDLKERAISLAAAVLEVAGKAPEGYGADKAIELLESGLAYQKFEAICYAQGGFREPGTAKFQYSVKASINGVVQRVDNRKLAKIAKLAGAPEDKASGVEFLAPIGTKVQPDQVLYVIHAESQGELDYALEYYRSQHDIITIN